MPRRFSVGFKTPPFALSRSCLTGFEVIEKVFKFLWLRLLLRLLCFLYLQFWKLFRWLRYPWSLLRRFWRHEQHTDHYNRNEKEYRRECKNIRSIINPFLSFFKFALVLFHLVYFIFELNKFLLLFLMGFIILDPGEYIKLLIRSPNRSDIFQLTSDIVRKKSMRLFMATRFVY